MPKPAELIISIVSYNTHADLEACLASIFKADIGISFEVVVVDNGSTDGSAAMVLENFAQVALIETGENLGYGRANNRALLGTPANFYLIANSDIVVEPGSIDRLVEALQSQQEAGAAMGALVNPDGTMQMTWAAGELTVASVLWEQAFLARLFPRSPLFGDYFRTYWDHKSACFLPQACGAFMMVRADLYNKLGGFDPAYFMYCEDTDLSKRVRDAGYKIVYVPEARAIHGHGRSSAGALRPRMILAHNQSRITYLTRFAGARAARKARAIMVAGAALRVILWGALGLIRPSARERARGFATVWRETRKISIA